MLTQQQKNFNNNTNDHHNNTNNHNNNKNKEVKITFNYQLTKEYERITKQIALLEESLKHFPEGELLCTKNGPYVKWLRSDHKHSVYIPKHDRHLAELLAAKKYYTLQLKELSLQHSLLSRFLERYHKCPIISTSLLDDSSMYKELLAPHFQSLPDQLRIWVAEDFNQNKNHPENLIYKTLAGHNVRSKSEVIIANALYLHQIPYRYECECCINGILFYPDFTILHPQTLELIYWEHFGMMDNPSYRDNAFNKLKIFSDCGIIPSINLITTFETKLYPINSEKIQQLIQENFL